MTENPKDTSLSQYDANNDVLADDGKYRGDSAYQLKEIVITSPSGGEVDVAEIFTQCSIYEDLMANTMSASLSFIDTNNIVKHLPILGQSEKLKIIFQSPSMDKVTYEFLIYKVGVRALSTVGKKQSVTIRAVSSEQFKNTHKRISKSYYDKIDKMVSSLFDEIKDGKELEVKVKSGTEKRKFIIPNWHPFDAINWLAQRCTAEENSKACHYVFYQDRDGYKFTTIEKLFEEDTPKMSYLYSPRRYRENPNNFRDVGFEFRNIQRLIIDEPGNRLDENLKGMYGSKILTHDIVRKKYEFTEFSLKDEYSSTEHVDKAYPICEQLDKYSSEPDTFWNFCPIHKNLNQENELNGGDTIEQNEKYSEWLLRRKSLMRQLSSYIVNVTVSGDSRRKCGDTVDLRVTPLQPGDEEQKHDKYLNGIYLVSSIKHNITPDGYLMDMELARDAVGEAYPASSNFLGSMNENKQTSME
jgi:hypothetical protein